MTPQPPTAETRPHRAPCTDGDYCGGPHCPPPENPETPALDIPEGAIAVIHVSPNPRSHAYPIVYRCGRGWQSGEHRYPDRSVIDFRVIAESEGALPGPLITELERCIELLREDIDDAETAEQAGYHTRDRINGLETAVGMLMERVEQLRAAPAETPTPAGDADLTERLAARVHEAWMKTKLDQGVTSRPSADGEEQMVPYERLSEPIKDLDRSTVLAVLSAIAEEGLSVTPAETPEAPEPREIDESTAVAWADLVYPAAREAAEEARQGDEPLSLMVGLTAAMDVLLDRGHLTSTVPASPAGGEGE